MALLSSVGANKLQARVSEQFIERFTGALPGAARLKSREPAAAWKDAGSVAFVSIDARLTPAHGTVRAWGPPPLVLRVDINGRPPPGLRYALRNQDFRSQLDLAPDAALAGSPQLELQMLPDEVAEFGDWLPSWYDWVKQYDAADPRLAPRSPCVMDEDSVDDLAGPIQWTRAAADQLRYWYANENRSGS